MIHVYMVFCRTIPVYVNHNGILVTYVNTVFSVSLYNIRHSMLKCCWSYHVLFVGCPLEAWLTSYGGDFKSCADDCPIYINNQNCSWHITPIVAVDDPEGPTSYLPATGINLHIDSIGTLLPSTAAPLPFP
jgi:hypothetical protein